MISTVFSTIFKPYNSGLQKRVRTGKPFFLYSTKTYVVCTQKNRLNETALLNTKHMFKLMGKEINAILGAQTILIWTFDTVTCWWSSSDLVV